MNPWTTPERSRPRALSKGLKDFVQEYEALGAQTVHRMMLRALARQIGNIPVGSSEAMKTRNKICVAHPLALMGCTPVGDAGLLGDVMRCNFRRWVLSI